jgi:tetratricopeptide (TPR) repeat protein
MKAASRAGKAGGGDVPFESAASELVCESAHPLEQLQLLDTNARDLEKLGDKDAVVECRIKQKALHQVLVYLYGFPLQPLVRAQAVLAEAYAAGGYFQQAHEHLAKAREVSSGGIYDDAQCQRLQIDLLIAEGAVRLAQDQYDAAQDTLEDSARLLREVLGELDVRAARIHVMLARIARHRQQYLQAIEYLSAAWEVRSHCDGADGEEAIRLHLQIAELEYLAGRVSDAVDRQAKVIENVRRLDDAELLVESTSVLARWLEALGKNREALQAWQVAEEAVATNFGDEDKKSIEVKRDVALLHLKLDDHETALRYLNDVHYFERRLHGSQSTSVARTLKALGTVHMVRRNLEEAERCLLQSLRIFEAEHPTHAAIVKDIHAKLASIAALGRGGVA